LPTCRHPSTRSHPRTQECGRADYSPVATLAATSGAENAIYAEEVPRAATLRAECTGAAHPGAGVTADGGVALGAAVEAMLRSTQGVFPTVGSLTVTAAWAAIFGFAAVKLFRWE